MKNSFAQALLIASVFWVVAAVVVVAEDSVLRRPVTTQAELASDPWASSAQDGYDEPRARSGDGGASIDEPSLADVQPARAIPAVATWPPQREAGPGFTARDTSSSDSSAAAPGSRQGSLSRTPTQPTEPAPEPIPVKAGPPAAQPEPPAAKPEPPAAKPEPPAAKPEPPAAKPEPPGPKADPPGPKADPPGPKADPPAGKADPPGPKADPPAGKADPPGPKADPPAGKADPPGPKAEPPAAKPN